MNNKTKNLSKALLLGTAIVSLNGVAAEMAMAATGAGVASAEVLTPITITSVTPLHFGSLTVGGAAGTVTLPTTDATARTAAPVVAGGVVLVDGTANPPTVGVMEVASAGGVAIQASVVGGADPVGSRSVVIASGANEMEVFDFDVDLSSALTTGVNNVETVAATAALATIQFAVGAKLNVDASQPAGAYTGAYTLNAVYN